MEQPPSRVRLRSVPTDRTRALTTRRDRAPDQALLDQAFTRAAGAPLLAGNKVPLLKDAAQNYPAWLEAIHNARRRIYFENYFVVEDRVGAEFAAALASRAPASACGSSIREKKASRLRGSRTWPGLPSERVGWSWRPSAPVSMNRSMGRG